MLRKVVAILLAILFFILGLVGLAIPVIPQVPFFCLSVLFLASASKKVHDWMVSTKIYQKYLKKHVDNSKILSGISRSSDEKENDETKV